MHGNYQDPYPLTDAQLKVWYGHIFDQTKCSFNIGDLIELMQPIEVDVFERSLDQVVASSDSLRSVFFSDGESVFAALNPNVRARISTVVYNGASEAAFYQMMQRLMQEPFDLSKGPLFAFSYIVWDERRFLLHRYHHLISDGSSFSALIKRAFLIYDAEMGGERVYPVNEPPYRLVHEREAKYKNSPQYSKDQTYWSELARSLVGAGSPSELPLESFESVTAVIDTKTFKLLRNAARELDVSIPVLFTSISLIFCKKLLGVDLEVAIIALGGRSGDDKEVIGLFSRLVPVFPKLLDGWNVQQTTLHVAAILRKSLRHSRYQGPEVDRFVRSGSISSPTINYMKYDYGTAPMRAVRCLGFGPIRGFTINAYERTNLDQLVIELACDDRHGTVDWLNGTLHRFLNFVEIILDNVSQPIGSIELLEDQERHQILVEWNDTSHPVPEAT
ncbi:condensation domain-containing protein, partial [Rhizobium paknamense]